MRNLITIIVLFILVAAGYYLWKEGRNMPPQEEPVACTAEAKLCPDGSYVGRTGPDCEFAPCPGGATGAIQYESPLLEVGNSTEHFSLIYPSGWGVNEAYAYSLLGPDSPGIPGVKFTVPSSMSEGTNLSSDSGVSVEYLGGVDECSAEYFLYEPMALHTVEDMGVTYSIASMAGIGAGNHYEEQVWALVGSSPCVALRYYTHSTVVENYPEGTVTVFDKEALLQTFDTIRESLREL